jgi:hypothetical protein
MFFQVCSGPNSTHELASSHQLQGLFAADVARPFAAARRAHRVHTSAIDRREGRPAIGEEDGGWAATPACAGAGCIGVGRAAEASVLPMLRPATLREEQAVGVGMLMGYGDGPWDDFLYLALRGARQRCGVWCSNGYCSCMMIYSGQRAQPARID